MVNFSPASLLRGAPLCATLLSSVFAAAPALGHSHKTRRAAADEHGTLAYAFDMSEVRLLEGRWLGNQERTLNYLLDVDVDRLLYVFRNNHGLDTLGVDPTDGWEGMFVRSRGMTAND